MFDSRTMKVIILGLLLLGMVRPVLAVDRAELDDRVRMLTGKFEALQSQGDKRVPAEVLDKAKGIILLDTTKAGFMFAFQGGDGVAMVKDKWGNWSPVAFLNKNEGSFGFQAGGQRNFYVILLMNTNATHGLLKSAVEFGGEAQGTAGNNSSKAEGQFVSPLQSVLVYDDHDGFYAGAALKTGRLAPADDDNKVYYGQSVTMSDILFDKKLGPTQVSYDLAKKIKTWSNK
jgi:SH3 domain-containing YSC84-like protein 1